MTRALKIAVSVGELSGDQHASKVIERLKSRGTTLEVRGMGGRNLRAAGVDTVIDSETAGGLMGFTELFGSLGKTAKALREMRLLLSEFRPDILLLVDYPDFNLRLAKHAHKLGIQVIYYISPKVWVWRASRVRAMSRYIDHLAVIFPFEPAFFSRRGLSRTTFVGHPFIDTLTRGRASLEERAKFCKEFGIDSNSRIVGVFPGSRRSELKQHIPIAIEALTKLRVEIPNLVAVFAVAPNYEPSDLKAFGNFPEWIRLVKTDSIRILKVSDVGLLKSGTCNLEAAFCELPFVCFFKTSAISAWIIRSFTKIAEYSIVNIIRPKAVREVMQEDATAENISAELRGLLLHQQNRESSREKLAEVVNALDVTNSKLSKEGGDSFGRVADIILQYSEHPRLHESPYRRLVAYLSPYKAQFLLALLCMVVFGASDGVVPFIVKHILDKVFQAQDTALLYAVIAGLVVFAIVRAVADFGQQFVMSRIGHNIVRDIRNALNRHILSLSPGYFVRNSTANLISRITSDVVMVRSLLTDSIASILRDSIRVIALLGAALYLDPILALLAVVVFPVGVLPVYRIGRRMRKLSRKGQEGIGALSGILQESVLGNRVVKIFGREEYEVERFEEENDRLNRTFVKSEVARALTGPINEILAAIAVSGVILYGGYSVINGVRSQGDFIAFLISVFLLYDPAKKLSRVHAVVQQGVSGAERIFEILDTHPEIEDPSEPQSLVSSNTITFDNVTFTYEGSEQAALSNISLEIPEGKKIALVGFSGAGKSTLIDLIPRFIDPQSGKICIGGVNVSTVKLSELRARIALVGQHTFLFNESVFNNIAYGNPHASKSDVDAAARAAYAYDFIMQLPEGFDTIVGEAGLSLSGGERQRIAIARAILKNAPILILDEATASLDNRSEREVQSAIEALERGRTSLVIAHRLSTVQDADRIVVMQDGRIIESGKHEELLSKGGEYSRLYALQFREPNESADAEEALFQ